jgi:Na+-translocating ferredoxin:NAD+ oxidoreductase RnfC subunit
MSTDLDVAQRSPAEIADALRRAGLSGAGGGGFPTYAKWQSLDDIDHLLVNHQESEPNCYVDKWIGREHAAELADTFDALLAAHLDSVVIGAKLADRDPWVRPLEDATGATVYLPDDLPIDPGAVSDVVIAYTDSAYELGMENVLLQKIGGLVIGKDLPIDYGWIVQNTETVYDIWRAFALDTPVLHRLVHVDGYRADGSRIPHRMFEAPIGTSAAALFDAAGVDPDTLASDRTLVEGGPGWCFKVQRPADRYGVAKHTNCLMLLNEAAVAQNTYGNGRINVIEPLTWSLDDPDTVPTAVDPDRVHVPIVTNETYDDLVTASKPTVEFGDRVSEGQPVAEPHRDKSRFSVAHHTPIEGQVSDVTPREVEVRRPEV